MDLSSRYSDSSGGGLGGSHRAPTGSADDDDVRATIDDEQDAADNGEDRSDDAENERPG